jgi:hypothetical protein
MGQAPTAAVPVTQPQAPTAAPTPVTTGVTTTQQQIGPPVLFGVPTMTQPPPPVGGGLSVLTTPTADYAAQPRVPTPSVATQPDQVIVPGAVAFAMQTHEWFRILDVNKSGYAVHS